MEKLDLKKSMQPLYQPSARQVVEVEVPEARFLMVDDTGDPNTSPDYAAAIEALYAVAYTIKFAVKKGPLAIDYGVMPLEGLWWADDLASFTTGCKQDWKWTMMICQPAFVTTELIAQAIAEVRAKKNPPALDRLRVDTLAEGRALRADPARRPVHRGRAHRGEAAPVHRRTRPDAWPAPRDLSERHPQGRAGELENHPAPAHAITFLTLPRPGT